MPASPPTLRDMIQEAVDRGQTYEQLAAAAVDEQSGERVSRSLLNNIVLRKVDRMPYDYHLRAIAAALGKPYEVVRKAAISQWLPPENAAAGAGAIERVDKLIEEARRLREDIGRQAGETPAVPPGERETA